MQAPVGLLRDPEHTVPPQRRGKELQCDVASEAGIVRAVNFSIAPMPRRETTS